MNNEIDTPSRIATIINSTGLSAMQFSKEYEIPYRTLQTWLYGQKNPPKYVLKMLERIVGLDNAIGRKPPKHKKRGRKNTVLKAFEDSDKK